jgi:hypothetical protein
MNLIHGDSIVSLPDDEVIKIMKEFKDEIKELWKIRKAYLENPLNPEVLKDIEPIKAKIREKLIKEMKARGWDFKNPLFYPLEFFFLYFDENGEVLPNRGFDGVIGNPPWETIEPNEKEFVAKHENLFKDVFPHGVTKFSVEGKKFKRLFSKKLESDDSIRTLWEKYYLERKNLSDFIRQRFKLSTVGKSTYQKVFLERALELSKNAVILLVPSNFHTDEGAMSLRKEIFDKYCLKELISFENRGNGWFKEVHPQFKFDIVFVVKEPCNKPFRAGFYITREDYENFLSENQDKNFIDFINEISFEYPVELISKMSPDVLGVVEFKSKKDVELVEKIRGDYPLLKDYGYILIQGDFNMTADNKLFNSNKKGLILYEGKMIHQYNPFFAEPRYWVEEEKGRERLLSKELYRIRQFLKGYGERIGLKGKKLKEFIDKNIKIAEKNFKNGIFKLDYEEYRLVYRAIASSTNERTLISCVLPKKVFIGHSLNYFKVFHYDIVDDEIVQKPIPYEDMIYLMALLNSFVLDYYIRLRVSANLTMFFLYELPIPNIDNKTKQKIVELAFRLLYRKEAYNEMAKNLGIEVKEIIDEDERREIRAELEVIIAKDVFKLDKEDMEYILSTFIYGNPDRKLMEKILEKF